jgi:hypothetical protein
MLLMNPSNHPLKVVGAACLAASLVSSWDTPVEAQAFPTTFTGEITPTSDLSEVYFLFAAGPCAPAYSKKIADFIPGNTTTSFTITLNSIYSYDGSTPYVGSRFAILGLYNSANGGVSVGFDPNLAANILSQSPAPQFNGQWTDGFGPAGSYDYGVDESVVAGALQSGSYNGASLNDSSSGGLYIDPNAGTYYWDSHPGGYYSQISTDPQNPAAFTLVDFSGASAGGSGYVVEVVPEPATTAFLAAGVGLFSLIQIRPRRAG